jgi:hypothetical protein
MSGQFYNPRHSVAFRGLHLAPRLVIELDRYGIVMMMKFTDVTGECSLQLDLPDEPPPEERHQ